MVDSAAHLVDEVLPKRPIRQWVLSVPYPLRYLFATNPRVMSQVLTIVHRLISTFLIKRGRMTVKSGAQSGAVTLIQRFGSALNLNPHFHMLYLNGVYDAKGYFWPVKPPTCEDLDVIVHTIAQRVARFLERAGYLYRDAESEYLDLVSFYIMIAAGHMAFMNLGFGRLADGTDVRLLLVGPGVVWTVVFIVASFFIPEVRSIIRSGTFSNPTRTPVAA